MTVGVGLGKGVTVAMRVGAGDVWETVGVDVTEAVPGDKVRVARRRVAVGVDVALGVAVDEGVRVALGVGVSDGIAVALGEGTGVALGEGDCEAAAVSARVGNDTSLVSGVRG